MTELNKLTAAALAAELNGGQYREVPTKDQETRAKAAGLVIVYGASDDLVEFGGAIYDEAGASDDESAVLVDVDGLLDRGQIDDHDDEAIAAFVARKRTARKIIPRWDNEGYSWTYSTDIPHEVFDVMEDGEKYCRGMVFELAALKAA